MANIGGLSNHCTAYEIQAIETYLAAPVKLISVSTASNRLKLFEPQTIENRNSPSGFYYISDQSTRIYEHYKKCYPNKIEKQKLNNYEELKHKAISYCEAHFDYYQSY